MQWSDLWSALALVMIIEGVLPFLNPDGFKRYLKSMQEIDSKSIRTGGGVLMVLGLICLYLVRQ